MMERHPPYQKCLTGTLSASPPYALIEQPGGAARDCPADGPKADKARALKPRLLQKDKREDA